MYFVVAIDLDTDSTDYKVFEKYKDAKDRYYAAYGYVLNGHSPNTKTGKLILVEAARLYRIETDSLLEAKEIVQRGEGELLEDTDKPLELILDL